MKHDLALDTNWNVKCNLAIKNKMIVYFYDNPTNRTTMFFYYFHRFFFLLLEEKMGKKTEIPTKEKYKMKNSGIVLFSQETTRSVSSPQ
jgi:hypothetical protein